MLSFEEFYPKEIFKCVEISSTVVDISFLLLFYLILLVALPFLIGHSLSLYKVGQLFTKIKERELRNFLTKESWKRLAGGLKDMFKPNDEKGIRKPKLQYALECFLLVTLGIPIVLAVFLIHYLIIASIYLSRTVTQTILCSCWSLTEKIIGLDKVYELISDSKVPKYLADFHDNQNFYLIDAICSHEKMVTGILREYELCEDGSLSTFELSDSFKWTRKNKTYQTGLNQNITIFDYDTKFRDIQGDTIIMNMKNIQEFNITVIPRNIIFRLSEYDKKTSKQDIINLLVDWFSYASSKRIYSKLMFFVPKELIDTIGDFLELEFLKKYKVFGEITVAYYVSTNALNDFFYIYYDDLKTSIIDVDCNKLLITPNSILNKGYKTVELKDVPLVPLSRV